MKTKSLAPKRVTEIETHSWFAFEAAFSPDSRTLAVGTRDKKGFAFIDTKTWKVRHWIAAVDSPPTNVEFSRDSKSCLVSLSKEHPLFCLDPMTGTARWKLEPGSMHAVFSSDGRTVAATRAKDVLICDAATGQVLHQMKGHGARVDITAFSNDGKRVASVSGAQVNLWDTKSGKLVSVVQQKQGSVNSVGFSPTEPLLVTAAAKGSVRVFEAASGKEVGEFEGHENDAWDLAFTPDGKRLVTGGWDPAIRVWDVAKRQPLLQISADEEYSCAMVALSADGKIVASPFSEPEPCIRLWRVDTGELVATIPVDGEVSPTETKLVFSANGQWLAAACDDGTTRVWSVKA